MNLQSEINSELWASIKTNYNNESFSEAILDAMHFLTELIRNKTGLEGDGVALVNQAFGSKNPKIKINKLQTDSEKDVQKGVLEILIGMYTGIRNPRSHDRVDDSQGDADSIIYFINYLVLMIEKSKLSFDESSYLERVFDEYYVCSNKYSELLVNDIPNRQRKNIAIKVIIDKKRGDVYKISSFMTALFDKLEEHEIEEVYEIVSEELKLTIEHSDIKIFLKICPPKYWQKIDKSARIRVENILMNSVKSGKYNKASGKCSLGWLGTWIDDDHIINFIDTDTWIYILVEKLKSNDDEEQEYVNNYFWEKLVLLNTEKLHWSFKEYIKNCLANKERGVVKKIECQIIYNENHVWWKEFEEELKEYPDIKYCDELPF